MTNRTEPDVLREAIPEALRVRRGWLLWKLTPSGRPDAKPRKVPYYTNGEPRHGTQGSDDDRAALASFDDALATLRNGVGYTGLGFAMLPDWGMIGIDLDNCLDTAGEPNPTARKFLEAAQATYVERSPSRKGLHIWLNGSFRDQKNLRAGVEAFCAKGFLTMTGDAIRRIGAVAPLAPEAKALLEAELPQPSAVRSEVQRPRNVQRLIEDLPGALGKLKADDRELWLKVCWAVGRDTAQSPEAFEIVLAWAATSDLHRPREDRRHMEKEFFEKSIQDRANPVTTATIFKLARDAGWRPEREWIFDAERARVSLGETLPEPQFIVPGYLPFGTVGGMPAEGGVGKTTFTLWEAVHIALGRRLFDLEIKRPGAVVFVTAEDDRATLAYRLQGVCRAMNLADADREQVEQRLFIEDVTGRMLRLVQADESGNLAATQIGDRLIDAYRERDVVLVNFDPTNLFGPGERFVNDAEAALMVEGQRIARELGCSVRFVHHISKAAARDRVVDQYLGRGGAAFADNSRFQHHLVRHEAGPSPEYPLPALADATENSKLQIAAQEGRAMRLHVTKLSWAARPIDPIWLVRDGYLFRPVAEARMSRQELSQQQALDKQRRIVSFVREKLAAGVRLSESKLTEENFRSLQLTRPEARQFVHELLARGHLKRVPLPPGERLGRRTDYLEPGDVPLPEEPF